MAKEKELKQEEEVQAPAKSLMDRLFEMVLGLMTMKVQSISVHQAVNVHSEVKSTVDADMQKCKMFMSPFGVILISMHPKQKKEFKRLITFNNCYEIHFKE